MSPEIGQSGFRIAVLLVVASAGLLLILRPETAEYEVSLLTLLIGLLFGIVLVLLVKRGER